MSEKNLSDWESNSMSEYDYNEIDLQFLRYFNSLYKDIEYANCYYSLIEYFGKLDEEKSKVLKLSSFSWNIIFDALNDDFIITMSRVYDLKANFEGRSDINIIRFIDFVKRNFETLYNTDNVIRRNKIDDNSKWKLEAIPQMTIADLENDYQRLYGLEEKIQALLYFRDKSYAHSDFEFAKGASRKVNPPSITYNEIMELHKHVSDLILRYRVAFDGNVFTFPAAKLHDIDNTIIALNT